MSAQAKMQAGLAFGTVLVIGMLFVSSFWGMVAGVIEAEPIIVLTNLVLIFIFVFALGYLLSSKWYKAKVKA